ncbi:envelope glycoprotein G [Leporid alphaherpesvirus 4]|uniref:Envelope glycoprotein G n=1 Tax=Leporid alphaherpesvirus 4 TaxID=481315 RepID=J9QQT8_9ALPH|nr:envelope glycoprotein G [Leporid alphaherpesvirus 4]AFR32506.1 envelope glycoprotein G [Leporid alphaherpesvirus 4]
MQSTAARAHLWLLIVFCGCWPCSAGPRPPSTPAKAPLCYPFPVFSSRGPSGPIRVASAHKPGRVVHHPPTYAPAPTCQITTLSPPLRHYGKRRPYNATLVYYTIVGTARRPLIMRQYSGCAPGHPPSPNTCNLYSFTYFNGAAPSAYAIANASLVGPAADPFPRQFGYDLRIGRTLHTGEIRVAAGGAAPPCTTVCATSLNWDAVPRCSLGLANARYRKAATGWHNRTADVTDFVCVASASQSVLAASAEAVVRDAFRVTRVPHSPPTPRPGRVRPILNAPGISPLMKLDAAPSGKPSRRLLSLEMSVHGDRDRVSAELSVPLPRPLVDNPLVNNPIVNTLRDRLHTLYGRHTTTGPAPTSTTSGAARTPKSDSGDADGAIWSAILDSAAEAGPGSTTESGAAPTDPGANATAAMPEVESPREASPAGAADNATATAGAGGPGMAESPAMESTTGAALDTSAATVFPAAPVTKNDSVANSDTTAAAEPVEGSAEPSNTYSPSSEAEPDTRQGDNGTSVAPPAAPMNDTDAGSGAAGENEDREGVGPVTEAAPAVATEGAAPGPPADGSGLPEEDESGGAPASSPPGPEVTAATPAVSAEGASPGPPEEGSGFLEEGGNPAPAGPNATADPAAVATAAGGASPESSPPAAGSGTPAPGAPETASPAAGDDARPSSTADSRPAAGATAHGAHTTPPGVSTEYPWDVNTPPEDAEEPGDYVPGNVDSPYELPTKPRPGPSTPARPKGHTPLLPFLTSSPALDVVFVISVAVHVIMLIMVLALGYVVCVAYSRAERARYYASRYAHIPLRMY